MNYYLKFSFIFFIILNFDKINAQNYQLPSTYDECMRAATNWCNCYFNECYSGRKFKEIYSIKEYYQMNDELGDHTYIQGKVHYDNYLDLPQSWVFIMKVYGDKIIFSKQSVSPSTGKLVWETCSKRRGYCR